MSSRIACVYLSIDNSNTGDDAGGGLVRDVAIVEPTYEENRMSQSRSQGVRRASRQGTPVVLNAGRRQREGGRRRRIEGDCDEQLVRRRRARV